MRCVYNVTICCLIEDAIQQKNSVDKTKTKKIIIVRFSKKKKTVFKIILILI